MAVCTDAEPCWQFSGELTKAALFPQVTDYFIWLIVLSVVCGLLLTGLILAVIFLCSERKKSKQVKELKLPERVQALEGGRPYIAPAGDNQGLGKGGGATVAGGYVDENNFDPYPPPKQIRVSRAGRSRGDLVLENGEVVSKRARGMSASDLEQRIAANQAVLMERAGINAGRLSGSNAADMRLQDTLTNDPYAEEVDEGMTFLNTAPLAEEKEFFYGDESAGELNAPIAFDPYAEEEETEADTPLGGGFEAMVRAEYAKEKEEEIAPKAKKRSVVTRMPTRNAANAMHFDPYAVDEEDAVLEEQLAEVQSVAPTNPTYTGKFSKDVIGIRASTQDSLRAADEGKDMRYATMLKTELSKVKKKQDLVISTPVVAEKNDERMTSAAKDQLERDKRTLLAGLTANDIEANDTPPARILEKKKSIKLSRQSSRASVASSDTIYNNPYAE